MTEVLLHSPIETTNQTPPSFEEVYRKHFRDIVGYLYWRSGNYMLAEDLAQKVFLKLFETHTNTKGEITIIKVPDKTTAFLRRVASRVLIDHHRTKRNRSMDDIEELVELPERVSINPERLAIIKEGVEERAAMVGRLKRGMQTLRPGYRDVLETSYGEGRSDPEIARIFEKPLGTVKSTKSRAKIALVGEVFPGGISTYNLPDSLREVEDYPF